MSELDRIIDVEVVTEEPHVDPAYGGTYRPYDFEGQWTQAQDFDSYAPPPHAPTQPEWDVAVADTRRRWPRIGAITAAVLITASAAVASAIWLWPAAHRPPPPNIDAVQLPLMTLDTDLAVPGVQGWVANSTEIADPDVNPTQCGVVYAPDIGVAVTGVARGAFIRKLTPFDPRAEQLVQVLLAVDTPEHAKAAADEEVRRWTACGGVDGTVGNSVYVNTFTVEPVETVEGVATTQWDIELSGGWGCQRAVAAWRNVLIDVSSCGQRSVRQAVAVTHQIIERGEHLPA